MNINDPFLSAQRPVFKMLTEEQKKRIHEGSLELLERTGSDFHSQDAIDLLESVGARVLDSKRVKIPSYVIEEAIRNAPNRVVLANRKAERVSAFSRSSKRSSTFSIPMDRRMSPRGI